MEPKKTLLLYRISLVFVLASIALTLGDYYEAIVHGRILDRIIQSDAKFYAHLNSNDNQNSKLLKIEEHSPKK